MSRRDRLWPAVRDSLDRLRETYDCVVIEGAGSPAEINLRAGDIVNMAVALYCGADVYLVADIDRGGAYATCSDLGVSGAEERRLVRGFVLNKFAAIRRYSRMRTIGCSPAQASRWSP